MARAHVILRSPRRRTTGRTHFSDSRTEAQRDSDPACLREVKHLAFYPQKATLQALKGLRWSRTWSQRPAGRNKGHVHPTRTSTRSQTTPADAGIGHCSTHADFLLSALNTFGIYWTFFWITVSWFNAQILNTQLLKLHLNISLLLSIYLETQQ